MIRFLQVHSNRDELYEVGPGTTLQIQTAQGPMTLTVDSQMNPEGYVHAYGQQNGRVYAGYVKLTAANPAASQALESAPTSAQQELSNYPLQNPMSQQVAYNQAVQQWNMPQPSYQAPVQQPAPHFQLHISGDGAVTLNGQPVSAADSKTAAILRLLAKRASTSKRIHPSNLESEISQARSVLTRLESLKQAQGRREMLTEGGVAQRRHRSHDDEVSRRAILAAMRSLSRKVDDIAQKQKTMESTVSKVSHSKMRFVTVLLTQNSL